MSGLLPRTKTNQGSGNFTDLSAQSLVVSGTAFISNLVTAVFEPSVLLTSQINGNPSLTISTGATPTAALIVGSSGISHDDTTTRVLGLSPGDNATLVYKTNVADTSSVQTFSNKTLLDGSTTIANTSDTTKKLKFSLGGGAGGLLTTLTFAPQTVARALVFPDASDTVVVQNLAQTLTTKTLDSAGNTITITSGGLAGTNINSVLNQAVLTTSTPTFGITTISYATSQAGLVIDNTNTGVTTSGLVCRVNGTSTFNLGVNASTSESYLYTLTNVPIKFGTNNTERFRIDTAGAATYSNVTSVTQTIGGNNTFALGSKGNYAYSNANGAIFTGANNGDINLQNTDSTKGINIGVGSTTPQFNCNSSTITLAVNTVRQTINNNNTYALGTKADYSYSSGAGAYFTSAAAGDINIRNTDTTKSLNLGVGSATAQLSIANALITTNVTLKPNVSADETATNWAAINGSGNLVTRAISSGRFTPTWTTTSGFTAGPVANQMNYNRVGNVVNCTGALTGMGLAVGGNAGTLTLPVAPASFAAALDCTGVVTASDAITSVPVTGFVSAVTSTTTVRLTVKDAAGSTGTVDLYYAFSYELS